MLHCLNVPHMFSQNGYFLHYLLRNINNLYSLGLIVASRDDFPAPAIGPGGKPLFLYVLYGFSTSKSAYNTRSLC